MHLFLCMISNLCSQQGLTSTACFPKQIDCNLAQNVKDNKRERNLVTAAGIGPSQTHQNRRVSVVSAAKLRRSSNTIKGHQCRQWKPVPSSSVITERREQRRAVLHRTITLQSACQMMQDISNTSVKLGILAQRNVEDQRTQPAAVKIYTVDVKHTAPVKSSFHKLRMKNPNL